MECPACESTVAANAWICPHCDHILDTSFLGDDDILDIHEEKTGVLAWTASDPNDAQDDPPDAVILGNVNVSEEEFAVVTGPGGDGEGRTFVYYSAESSAGLIQPDAVPHLVRADLPETSGRLESEVLRLVDGRRTVREIQRASGHGAQDVVISLLTLLDKENIHFPKHAASRSRRPRSGQHAADPGTGLAHADPGTGLAHADSQTGLAQRPNGPGQNAKGDRRNR